MSTARPPSVQESGLLSGLPFVLECPRAVGRERAEHDRAEQIEDGSLHGEVREVEGRVVLVFETVGVDDEEVVRLAVPVLYGRECDVHLAVTLTKLWRQLFVELLRQRVGHRQNLHGLALIWLRRGRA